MPTFYFDIVQIDGTFVKDTVGAELDDIEAAKREAKQCLSEMAGQAINDDLSELRVEVRDAYGNRVALRVAHFDNEDSE